MKMSRLIIVLLLAPLAACHTTRHVVTNVSEQADICSVSQQQAISSRLDSLISHVSASADSITVLLYADAPTEAAPKARITVHSPRVNKEQRSGSATHVQTNMADSTRSNSEAHTSTDDSKESIGGAEPPNLTWVFIVLGLGITLLLLGAIFGYLFLHKRGIV